MMKVHSIILEPIRQDQLIRYAEASGDYNPIHTNNEEALKAGLPGVIAHGLLTMGFISRIFSPYLDKGMIREFSTIFLKKVFLGDRLTVQACWKDTEENPQGIIYYYDVWAQNQNQEIVAKGRIGFLVYPYADKEIFN